MSYLNWIEEEDATAAVVQPGEVDPDGDIAKKYLLVINNQWDGIGVVVTSTDRQGLEDFVETVKEALRTIPQD